MVNTVNDTVLYNLNLRRVENVLTETNKKVNKWGEGYVNLMGEVGGLFIFP